MKHISYINRYLSVTRGELKGTIILIGLLLIVNMIRLYRPETYAIEPSQIERFLAEVDSFEVSAGKHPVSTNAYPGSGSGMEQCEVAPMDFQTPDSNNVTEKRLSPSFILELNLADTFDLQRLKGIGPSFARRIFFYRDKLGGFVQPSQLLEVFGMDTVRYESIAPYLTADPSLVQPMDVNTATFKELISHPYLPYEIAKEIALLRKRKRGITGMDELKKIGGMTDSLFKRLEPYLTIRSMPAP